MSYRHLLAVVAQALPPGLALAFLALAPVALALQPADLPGSTMGYKPPPKPPVCDAQCQGQRARIRELEEELRWRRGWETQGYPDYPPPLLVRPPRREKPSWAW